MLFANENAIHGATLFSCLMAVLSGVFSWLAVREKRLSDTEKAQMKTDIAVLQIRVGDCDEDRNGLRAEVQTSRAEAGQLRAEVGQLRAAMERHGIDCPPHPGRGSGS